MVKYSGAAEKQAACGIEAASDVWSMNFLLGSQYQNKYYPLIGIITRQNAVSCAGASGLPIFLYVNSKKRLWEKIKDPLHRQGMLNTLIELFIQFYVQFHLERRRASTANSLAWY